MRVPLVDLVALEAPLRDNIETALAGVVARSAFVGGAEIAVFEESFAAYCGAEECVAVASGTEALRLALHAVGVTRGDEVITSALAFIAAASAVVDVGATPVLVDPDPDTGLVTPERVAEAITPRTAAIMPVHLWGQPCDMPGFRRLADQRGLRLIEAAGQAHGAAIGGRRVGAWGDVAGFSFHPGKNLGAWGDAGALTTSDATIAGRLRRLRDRGRRDDAVHAEHGWNSRMDTIQAAILNVKLAHLEAWNERRRSVAIRYDAAFADLAEVRPVTVVPEARCVYNKYVLRCRTREVVAGMLARHGVASGIHYPLGLHVQPSLAGVARPASPLPHAERLAATVLSIPVHATLTEADVRSVVEAVTAAVPARAA